MKSRGFTLVELLGVVFILALLGLLIIPVISNILTEKKKQLYEVQERNIEEGARSFMADHVFEYSISDLTATGFKIPYLQRLGYIKSDIKDPITGKDFSDDMVVVIQRGDDDLHFLVGKIEKDWNYSNFNSNYYTNCTVCSSDNECVNAEVLWRYD